MSITAIRAALETALAGMAPTLATAYENTAFASTTGIPYQAVTLMPAAPDNTSMGSGHYREQGIFQVSLFYPIQGGPAAAAARADLIRAAFKRGNAFVNAGITVLITKTPEISSGSIDSDRWMVPVKIRYQADIFN